MVDPLLLTSTRITTTLDNQPLSNATGFFYQNDSRLFLITSGHVFVDPSSRHHPDALEIELHTDRKNLAASVGFSIPLYRDGVGLWRQAEDSSGTIDIAAIEIDRDALPELAFYRAFTVQNLPADSNSVAIGSSLVVVGFPLGFHDSLHHLPVVRHAINASSFGLRFQGNGYFLTDSRTHRGTSGAAVVMRSPIRTKHNDLPWVLLGVHSTRLDIGNRQPSVDEALGLNCVWFADILPKITGISVSACV